MNLLKKYRIMILSVIIAVIGAAAINIYNHRILDELISPDGTKTVTVRRNGRHGHQIIFDEEHKIYNLGIGGEYMGVAFSPSGRYFSYTYLSESGITEYTRLIDFKLGMSGRGAVEVTARIDENFVPELKDPFILNDLFFDFVRWHETEDYMMYDYTATDIYGGISTGFVWYSPEYYDQKLVAINRNI